MLILPIIAGIATFLVVGSTVGVIVLNSYHDGQAGLLPGAVAGIWAAWPLLHQGKVERYNFLHPVPKLYKVPVKQAFSKIRKILDEKIYNFGDGWKVPTADTQERRIHATLRFTDEKDEHSMDARGGVHTRTKQEKRLLILDIQMKEKAGGATIVQFDFIPKCDGLDYQACDSIVRGLLNDVEATLGAGTDAGSQLESRVPAPPWWLLGLTAFALLLLLGDVMARVFHG